MDVINIQLVEEVINIQLTDRGIQGPPGPAVEETDPVFSAWNKSTGISITESQISDFGSYALSGHNHDAAYSAIGHNHSGVYLESETDPVFTAWDKSTGISITESQISDFGSYALSGHDHDAAYSAIGHDHSGVYLESETDPVFSAWDKSTGISITESQISDFGSYALSGHNHDGIYQPDNDLLDSISALYTGGYPYSGFIRFNAGSAIVSIDKNSYSLASHNHSGIYDPSGTASGLIGTHESTYNHGNIAHGETAYGWGNHASAGYAVLAGQAGGQTLYGGTASGNNLILHSTSNATKGKIFFGASSAYDGVNNRLGIGNTTPAYTLDVTGTGYFSTSVISPVISGQTSSGSYSIGSGSFLFYHFGNTDNIGNSLDLVRGKGTRTVPLAVSATSRIWKGDMYVQVDETPGNISVVGSWGMRMTSVSGAWSTWKVNFHVDTDQMSFNGTKFDILDSCQFRLGTSQDYTIEYDGVNDRLVFNEAGLDKDFRVEGDNDANLLFVDAGVDKIGIGTAAPAYKLDVNGDINIPAASTYRVNGVAGVSGSFTSNDGKTITVTKGIITAIV